MNVGIQDESCFLWSRFTPTSEAIQDTVLHDRLKLFLEEIHSKNLNQTLPKKRIDLHITHLEIAKLLQGSRQSVSLNLAKMRDEKIIDYDRNWMKIIDLKALRKWEL